MKFLTRFKCIDRDLPNTQQAVSNKVQEIAAQYTNEPEKSLYQKAASRFRVPFWDPFLPRNKVPKTDRPNEKIWGFPKILTTKDVWVKRPKGVKLDTMNNPLYAFNFPNKILKDKARISVDWDKTAVVSYMSANSSGSKADLLQPPQGKDYTVRAPSTDGETDISRLELGLRRQIISIGTNLWKLLSEYTDDSQHNNQLRTWSSFSTHNVIDPRTDKPVLQRNGRPVYQTDTAVSLESWHDNIHGLIGTGQGYGGHMGDPAIAGVSYPFNTGDPVLMICFLQFDPIFWLHHW